MSFFSAPSAPGVTGANSVPKPESDAQRNAAPEDEHKRVVDFVKVCNRRSVQLASPRCGTGIGTLAYLVHGSMAHAVGCGLCAARVVCM